MVHQDGIRFLDFRYLDLALAAHVGEPAVIRYDPHDMAEIRVFHRGSFLRVTQDSAEDSPPLTDESNNAVSQYRPSILRVFPLVACHYVGR